MLNINHNAQHLETEVNVVNLSLTLLSDAWKYAWHGISSLLRPPPQ